MYRLLLIVIALILYGSLFPWDFHTSPLVASPVWLLLHSWPTTLDRFTVRDAVVNVLLYFPLGVVGLLAFRQTVRTTVAIAGTALSALVLSSGIEIIQLFDGLRYCSGFDVVCNVGGAMIGTAIAVSYDQGLKRFLGRVETASAFQESGALLLLLVWIGYQGFPLFPVLSRTLLRAKFHTLLESAAISPLHTFSYFVEWLAVACLLESVVGSDRSRRWLPALIFFLPAKLLITGRTLSLPELAGAAMACAFWYYVVGRYKKRSSVAACLMVSVVILRGLYPFQWSVSPIPFSWIPFIQSLETERFSGLLTLLQKCFWYGSAIWLLRAAGWRLTRAAASVAVVLSAIEVIQMRLPGRSPEITDPLLALILAVALGLLSGGHVAGRRPFKVPGM